ncbi:hypothetical protein ACH5RR_025874 [Cinchona calisaya]|uniref:Uncharacterized protein n=1 Tax=Cinchona calisaya TaxID=153742 RepID=A0ABD2Z440_9GENT
MSNALIIFNLFLLIPQLHLLRLPQNLLVDVVEDMALIAVVEAMLAVEVEDNNSIIKSVPQLDLCSNNTLSICLRTNSDLLMNLCRCRFIHLYVHRCLLDLLHMLSHHELCLLLIFLGLHLLVIFHQATHTAKSCKVTDDSFKSFNAMSLTDPSESNCYPDDSGATAHMTPTMVIFLSLLLIEARTKL